MDIVIISIGYTNINDIDIDNICHTYISNIAIMFRRVSTMISAALVSLLLILLKIIHIEIIAIDTDGCVAITGYNYQCRYSYCDYQYHY